MRITTKSLLRNYKVNLNNSLSNLEAARKQVLTERQFNKMSEDPAAAVKAFQLRSEYSKNANYLSNLENAQGTLDSVESNLNQMNTIMTQIYSDVLQAVTGTTSDDQRDTIATGLREMQQSILLCANATYGGKFIFGGASTKEVPFELSSDGLTLTYRGIDVNSSDTADQTELAALADETLYTDLGFGLKYDVGGNLIKSSAFDTATPGIDILGYGSDGGMSNNIVVLIGQMADALESDSFTSESFSTLTDKFNGLKDGLVNKLTQLGTKSQFLETTKSRLEDDQTTLNEKIVAIEDVDLAEATTNYSWAQYAYQAALKVGNSILTPSFIDFMD